MQILLCTDLDRTLLPNGRQPESPDARGVFATVAARPEVTLAYATGRHRSLVEDAIREYGLPEPDWVVADVGTSIYQVENGVWNLWPEWEKDIATDWAGFTHRDLRTMFSALPLLLLQEEAKQNRYKLSYYLPPDQDAEDLCREMERRLEFRNIRATLVHSIDEASETGLLDVLPARATKLHAVEFLMRHLEFDYRNTVYAGDSGNDMHVFASPINSVVVANAAADISREANLLAEQNGSADALYLAKGDFLGMNGNYSAGIVEGLAHFLPGTLGWMRRTG